VPSAFFGASPRSAARYAAPRVAVSIETWKLRAGEGQRRSIAKHNNSRRTLGLVACPTPGRLPRLFTMDPKTISVGRRICRQQVVNSVAHEPPEGLQSAT
jgi:hypothetical protein